MPDPEDLNLIFQENNEVISEPDQYNQLRKLQAQYVSLFINALPETACPPYGSFYLEDVLMGSSAMQLKNLYLQYGFECMETPDHIAVELEFLAFLTTLRKHSFAQADYEFLKAHLKRWTPAFFECVEQNDLFGFYKKVSKHARYLLFKDTGQATL